MEFESLKSGQKSGPLVAISKITQSSDHLNHSCTRNHSIAMTIKFCKIDHSNHLAKSP